MLLNLRAMVISFLVSGFVVAVTSLSGCSCHCRTGDAGPAAATAVDEEARSGSEVGAGMVVYRDPQTGEITDSPSDDVGSEPGRPALGQPPQVEPAPGGGVMIKTDQSTQPY